MTTALLIIDVQHGLCSGEYEAFEATRVIQRINVVSQKMREAGAPVVVIQHEAPGGPLEYGTEGWNLAGGLDVQPTDIYVRKKATDSFHNTDRLSSADWQAAQLLPVRWNDLLGVTLL